MRDPSYEVKFVFSTNDAEAMTKERIASMLAEHFGEVEVVSVEGMITVWAQETDLG